MTTEGSHEPERDRQRTARRTVEQTRREREELTEQIRASRETIAEPEKVPVRLDEISRDLEGKVPSSADP
jgi:hypothetical protein